jgi:hypothetical protein
MDAPLMSSQPDFRPRQPFPRIQERAKVHGLKNAGSLSALIMVSTMSAAGTPYSAISAGILPGPASGFSSIRIMHSDAAASIAAAAPNT